MSSDQKEGFPGLRCYGKCIGFSLVELLVVVSISCAIMSFSAISISNAALQKGSDVSVIREAARFERWLEKRIFRACIERRSFTIKSLPGAGAGRYIELYWADTHSTETYDTRENCYFLRNGKCRSDPVFSPQWQTFSPAFTLKVLRSKDTAQIVKYVRVSLYSRVSITDDPPSY